MRSSQAFAGPQSVSRRTAIGVVRKTASAARAASFILRCMRKTSLFGGPLEYRKMSKISLKGRELFLSVNTNLQCPDGTALETLQNGSYVFGFSPNFSITGSLYLVALTFS